MPMARAPRERLRVGPAGEDDDRAGEGDVEDHPPVGVARQQGEAAVARVAEQLRAGDPGPVQVEDDLGPGADGRDGGRAGRDDQVEVGAGDDPTSSGVGEEHLAGRRRGPAPRGRRDPRAGVGGLLRAGRRDLDEARVADPLGEEVAGRDLVAGGRDDAIAGPE